MVAEEFELLDINSMWEEFRSVYLSTHEMDYNDKRRFNIEGKRSFFAGLLRAFNLIPKMNYEMDDFAEFNKVVSSMIGTLEHIMKKYNIPHDK